MGRSDTERVVDEVGDIDDVVDKETRGVVDDVTEVDSVTDAERVGRSGTVAVGVAARLDEPLVLLVRA